MIVCSSVHALPSCKGENKRTLTKLLKMAQNVLVLKKNK